MKTEALERAIQPSREKLFATEVFKRASAGTLSLPLYQGYLKETYHYVKHASRFYAAAAARLPEAYESVRAKLLRYAEEENGHEGYLLSDLSALGVSKELVRDATPLVETEALIGFHYYTTTYGNPLAVWGNIYAIEGLSLVGDEIAKTLMNALHLKENAFSFLISHGTPNLTHFEAATRVIEAGIHSEADRSAVTFCARAALELHAFMFQGIYENYGGTRDP